MKEAFTFDDVLIIPQFSTVKSRQEVDLMTVALGNSFRLPVISSNMTTITGSKMANAMIEYGAQACLHRFCTIEENVKILNQGESTWDKTGDLDELVRPFVSIGLGQYELDRAKALYGNNATCFVIDVAHGAQSEVVKQVKDLKKIVGDYAYIVVGNFASVKSVIYFLNQFGDDVRAHIDGIKIGIGPGSACTTRVKTGSGYPQFSAIMDISAMVKHSYRDIAIIADGGMRTSGDIVKALAAGADLVMLGGMLSGTDETPGETINVNNLYAGQDPFVWLKAKEYKGSASKESYQEQGKDESWRTAEGESFLVPCKGPVMDILRDIEGGLRSALAYTGAYNLQQFRGLVEFVHVTPNTVIENGAHGKKS